MTKKSLFLFQAYAVPFATHAWATWMQTGWVRTRLSMESWVGCSLLSHPLCSEASWGKSTAYPDLLWTTAAWASAALAVPTFKWQTSWTQGSITITAQSCIADQNWPEVYRSVQIFWWTWKKDQDQVHRHNWSWSFLPAHNDLMWA